MVRIAKQRGVRVTAEATPHHLVFSDEDLFEYRTDLKVNPPLRSAADREALREGLADGTIDAIATDHAPHSREEKEVEFDRASFGAIGMESAWPALFTHLVATGSLELKDLLAALTRGPARVLGMETDSLGLREGAYADLVLLDCEADYSLDASAFASLSRNCPFDGKPMKARVVCTIRSGEVMYESSEPQDAVKPVAKGKKGVRSAAV